MSTVVSAPMASTVNTPKAPAKTLSIKDHLNSEGMRQELARVLPKHCKPERMIRVALTAITRIPDLAMCDQASFFRCLLDLSQWGLEPDGRRAHLIPFRNNKRNCIECQLIIDYKGLVELAYNSGIVRSIQADVVRDGDLFEFNLGRIEKHTPWYLRRDVGKPAQAGSIFAVYCHVELKDGASKTEILSHADVESIRKRSKAGSSGPWVSDWSEMAKKTAFRRLTKWLPLSAEIRDAFDADDDRFEDLQPASTGMSVSAPRTVDDLSSLFGSSAAAEVQAAPVEVRPAIAEVPSSFDLADFKARLAACKSPEAITAVYKGVDFSGLGEEDRAFIDDLGMEREREILSGK